MSADLPPDFYERRELFDPAPRCPICGNPAGISDDGSTVCRDCRMDQDDAEKED